MAAAISVSVCASVTCSLIGSIGGDPRAYNSNGVSERLQNLVFRPTCIGAAGEPALPTKWPHYRPAATKTLAPSVRRHNFGAAAPPSTPGGAPHYLINKLQSDAVLKHDNAAGSTPGSRISGAGSSYDDSSLIAEIKIDARLSVAQEWGEFLSRIEFPQRFGLPRPVDSDRLAGCETSHGCVVGRLLDP
jgi:hypothetical protein